MAEQARPALAPDADNTTADSEAAEPPDPKVKANTLSPPTPRAGGSRRSPTTGHVRRKINAAERSSLPPPKNDDTANAEAAVTGTRRTKPATHRSLSSPGEDRDFQRISTSEDDDEYWYSYFATQRKSISEHNNNSLAAALAGVLRPAPPINSSRSPVRTKKSVSSERRKTDTTINRKSTAEKALGDRRPSAPNFATILDGEPLPPTPKPTLRKRVRSKSKGPPSTDSEDTTSSIASKDTTNNDKLAGWWKRSQGVAPSKKQVSSIDPSEVLKGVVPDSEVKKVAEVVERRQSLVPLEGNENNDEQGAKSQKKQKNTTNVKSPSPAKSKQSKPVNQDKKPTSILGKMFGKVSEEKNKVANGRAPVKDKINWMVVMKDIRLEWKAFMAAHPDELVRMRVRWNRCMASLMLMLVYCGLGGFLFRFIEGSFESFYKCGVKRVKRDFIDLLWTNSHNLREDEWKSKARRKLWEFEEQLHVAHEAGVTSYSGIKSWSFLNSVVYCLTVITTIGYGHISPSTTTGRAITIIYAVFGIPMFLILLADFGKLFTRGIKFVWSFVRRLYYTGSCRKIRRTQPMQDAMKGVQIVYDLAMFRRPSQFFPADGDLNQQQQFAAEQERIRQMQMRDGTSESGEQTPGTPAPSAFEVDDEFNLPISVAIFILLLYLFLGASIYYIWENWGFFESFYFVFISMSTIGFGDFVPQHPMYMMASIVYLVFGLALTSMCINVVQEKLSDSFRHASAKIGATIGLQMAEEEAASQSAPLETVQEQDDNPQEGKS